MTNPDETKKLVVLAAIAFPRGVLFLVPTTATLLFLKSNSIFPLQNNNVGGDFINLRDLG